MPYYYLGYGPMGSGFVGSLFMLVFWALVIWLVVVLVRRHPPHDHSERRWRHHDGPGAMDILNERYAKGEIDKKEYEEKKKDILG